jgi:hypothetical protein
MMSRFLSREKLVCISLVIYTSFSESPSFGGWDDHYDPDHVPKNSTLSEYITGYSSLFTMNWFQDHPNELPIDRDCEIYAASEVVPRLDRYTLGAIFGYTGFRDTDGKLMLTCRCEAYLTEFQIPIYSKGIRHRGAMFALFPAGSSGSIKVSQLDGHTVADLFGSYQGMGGGAALFVGGNGGRLYKDGERDGIRLTYKNVNAFGAGFGIEKQDMMTKRRRHLSESEYLNPYLLFNRKLETRSKAMRNAKVSMLWQTVSQLKFVKVSRQGRHAFSNSEAEAETEGTSK